MTISIPDFSLANVVVVGDVMLDRYPFGRTSRISPEAPVPVVHVRQSEDRPGGAANVAVNLARLGVRTTLLGIVGQDEEAVALRSALKQSDVECHFTEVAGWPTITKTRVQSRGQQLIRLDREEAGSEWQQRSDTAFEKRKCRGPFGLREGRSQRYRCDDRCLSRI